MPKRRALLVFVPYVLLGLLAGSFPRCEGPWDFQDGVRFTDATDPFTSERLRERLLRIAPLVSDVVGTPLDVDSLEILARDARVAAEAELRATLGDRLDTRREDFDQAAVSRQHVALQILEASRLAEYRPGEARIEVHPLGHQVLAPDEVEPLLDLVLAHELAHAWQDQRFGIAREEGAASTEEAELARAAVVEGTAEFVEREVARRLGLVHEFERVVDRREAQAAGAMDAVVQWMRWVYGEGLRFVEAVHASEGANTWARLFAAMPTDVWSIEHPQAWLARGGTPVEGLDAWGDRLLWLLDAGPAPATYVRLQARGPALRVDLRRRLDRAGLSPTDTPWDRCQGGLGLAGEPALGPLAGIAFVLHAWRFPTSTDARAARESLERAFEARGPVVWAGTYADEVVGAARVRQGANGTRVRTSLLFDDTPRWAHEGSWALRVEGSLLLEVFAWGEGIAPALLELLDVARVAREDADAIDAARTGAAIAPTPFTDLARLRLDPDLRADLPDADTPPPLRDERLARRLAAAGGEAEVRAWLDAHGSSTAWRTALGPGTGEEDLEERERGRILAGALASEDADLVRFALSALAEGRAAVSPIDVDVRDRVAALTAHPDPWIRSVAVRAADALGDEDPLDDVWINTLAEDDAPAVRAAVAVSRRLQRGTVRRIRRELQEDPHPRVRRAAAEEEPGTGDPTDVLVGLILGDPGGEASEATRDDPRDQAAANRLLWEVMGRAVSGRVDEALIERIRRLLVSPDPVVRVQALTMVLFLDDERARFLPELVRALADAGSRRVAATALAKGGLDLAPALGLLRRMLEDPHVRPDVLRVLAGNDLALAPADLERARGWMDARDAQVAAAAALLVLSRDVDDPRPLRVLESAWGRLPEGGREEALSAIVTHRPGSETGRRLLADALRSPFYGERSAAIALLPGEGGAEALEPLLDAVDDVGPAVADELLTRFLEAAQELDDAEGKQAGRLLARYLERWCDAGGLPVVDPDVLAVWTWPELPASPELVHALDRCLLLDDPSVLRHVLALLRSVLDRDRWPEDEAVGVAMERLCSLADAPEDLAPSNAAPLLEVYADRETVDPSAVYVVLRRAARPTRSDDIVTVDVEAVLQGHPRRVEAALELVPKFLDTGTCRATDVAFTVLAAAGPEAREHLPRLRSLAPYLLPSWRRRAEEILAVIEETEAED